MNEHEPTAAPDAREVAPSIEPDWRRLDVARRRFIDRIAEGTTQAMTEGTEISDVTARCIAHVLGRAYGRESALAGFGRNGEGHYLSLRDEYIDLYGDERADAVTKEWIDWLGTYLVQRENIGTGRRIMNELTPPNLHQLLVRTSVRVGDERYEVNIPADWHSGNEDDLIELLTTLRLPEDEALQAFLSLPDVSVGTEYIMESFHESYVGTFGTIEDAVHSLCEIDEWEAEVNEFAAERGLLIDQYAVDYETLADRLRQIYDLVQWKDSVYVFHA